jgi:hypothetical protein
MNQMKIAEIPLPYRKQGFQWLLMEIDTDDTGGTYVYLFRTLEKPCVSDYWFPNDDELNVNLHEHWGLAKEDFRPYEGPDIR